MAHGRDAELRALKGRTGPAALAVRRTGERRGSLEEASDLLKLFRNAAFWKNPEKIWLNLAKIQQILAKFAKFWKI